MASRPGTVPQLDTNQTNRTIPAPTKVTDGYVLNDTFPSPNANYLFGWAGDWLTWLDERTEDGTTPTTDFTLRGLDALTVTGDGGVLTLKGGDGGATSGNGGDILLLPGDVTSGTRGGVSVNDSRYWADVEIHPKTNGRVDVAFIGDNASTSYTELGFMSENGGSYYSEWYVGSQGYQNSVNPGVFYLVHQRNIAGTNIGKTVLNVSDTDVVSWLTDEMRINYEGGVQTDVTLFCDNNTASYNEIGFVSRSGSANYASWYVGAQGYQATINPGTFFIFHNKNVAGATVNSTPFYIGNDDKIGIGGVTTPLGDVHMQTSSIGAWTPNTAYDDLIIENDGWAGISIAHKTDQGGTIAFCTTAGNNRASLEYDSTNDDVYLWHNSGRFLSLDATGVGVNTTTPEGPLHVSDGDLSMTAISSIAVFERNGNCYISLLSPDASERGIFFGEPSSNIAGSIIYNDSATPDGIQFRVNGNQTVAQITAAGDFGIGTGPSAKLHVRGTNATRVRVEDIGTSGANTPGFMMYNETSFEGGLIYVEARDRVEILSAADGTYGAICIDSTNGNVGIGLTTTDPDTILHLKSTAPDITYEDTSGGDKFLAGNNNGTFRIRNVTDTRTDFSIDGDGVSSFANGVIITPTSGNIDGLAVTGYGTGIGVDATGGATSGSIGVKGTAGNTDGYGVYGVTVAGYALYGDGGTTGRGVYALGGSGGGDAVTGISYGGSTAVKGSALASGPGVEGYSASGYALSAGTNATRAPLHLGTQSSAPTVGALGDFYVNSGSYKLYFHNGTDWQEVAFV